MADHYLATFYDVEQGVALMALDDGASYQWR